MSVTKRILEDAILAILYEKSVERPLWINASEVYWSLPFAEVSEREVTAMLTELVEERRVKLYLGKYQLSKEEQVRLKERKLEELAEQTISARNEQEQSTEKEAERSQSKEKQAMPSFKPLRFLPLLAAFLLGLFLGGISWSYFSSCWYANSATVHHHTASLEELQRTMQVLQDKQALYGYLLLLSWLLLLAISSFLYYRWKSAEHKQDTF